MSKVEIMPSPEDQPVEYLERLHKGERIASLHRKATHPAEEEAPDEAPTNRSGSTPAPEASGTPTADEEVRPADGSGCQPRKNSGGSPVG